MRPGVARVRVGRRTSAGGDVLGREGRAAGVDDDGVAATAVRRGRRAAAGLAGDRSTGAGAVAAADRHRGAGGAGVVAEGAADSASEPPALAAGSAEEVARPPADDASAAV